MMMFAGHITIEDHTISFYVEQRSADADKDMAHVTVADNGPEPFVRQETYWCSARDLMCALAIALHYDGEPNAERDYPAAERAQGKIRWIP